MNKTASAKIHEEKNLFLCALRGLAVSALSALLTALISSAFALSLSDPDKYIKIFALVCLFVSSGFGGRAAARAKGKSAFLCGAFVGIIMIGVTVILCLALSLAIDPTLFAICAPTVLVTAILGAVSGVGTPKKSKRKKKKF